MHQPSSKASEAVRKRPRVGREPPIRPVHYNDAAHLTTANEGSPAKKRGIVDGTFNETITVIVGLDKKKYEVHKSYLVTQSQWFQTRLQAQSGKGLEIILEAAEPPTFDRFLAYIYSRSILKDGESYGSIAWTLLISLYLAADYLVVPKLENQVIDALTTKIDASKTGLIPSNLLHTIYNSTSTAGVSPLRRLAVDCYAWNLRSDEEKESDPFHDIGKGDLPSEFSLDLLKQLIIKAPNLHRNRIFKPISDEYYNPKSQAQTNGTP